MYATEENNKSSIDLNKTNKTKNKIILDLTNKNNTIEYRLNNNMYNPKNNGITTDWHKRLEKRINNLIII